MKHEKILSLLAGCDSAHPMPFDALVEKSGLAPDTLRMLLDRMATSTPASINRAIVTKDGETQVMIWPTGVIGMPQPFSVIQHQLVRRDELARPQTKPQEQDMSTSTPDRRGGSQPSALRIALEKLVAVNPGKTADELIEYARKVVPTATAEKVKKTLSNMVHVAHQARTEGRRGELRYYPTAATPKSATGTPKPEPKPEPKPDTGNRIATPDRSDISIMLSDDYHLHIGLGDDQICLNPEQLRRLDQFLDRVLTEGVPDERVAA